MIYVVKSWYEGTKTLSLKLTEFNWLLPQCKNLLNQLPVIKPSASASRQDIIGYPRGYLCERDLNLFVAT